jgi:hypothetical protein
MAKARSSDPGQKWADLKSYVEILYTETDKLSKKAPNEASSFPMRRFAMSMARFTRSSRRSETSEAGPTVSLRCCRQQS